MLKQITLNLGGVTLLVRALLVLYKRMGGSSAKTCNKLLSTVSNTRSSWVNFKSLFLSCYAKREDTTKHYDDDEA